MYSTVSFDILYIIPMTAMHMFDKAYKNTLVDNVVAQISKMILDGTIKKGALLPSENKLCRQFDVSRTTVRAALNILSRRNIIETTKGKGSTVIADNFQDLSEGLRVKIEQYESNFQYAIQVRRMLEPQIAFLAAINASENDISDLEAIVKRCQERHRDGTLESLDTRSFHLRLAAVPNNPLLYAIVELLISMCDAPDDTNLHTPNIAIHPQDSVLQDHEDVLKAIEEKNPEDAYYLMKRNISEFSDHCMSELEEN